MADYTNQQKAFITKMNQVDARHRAAAQQRNAQSAPYATGGKAQPRSGSTKKITVKKHTRTVTKAPKAPAIPQAPAGPTDQALINAAIRTRYGPAEQALNAQLGQNARFTSGVGDWYSNALNEIKGLRDQGNAASQQTLGRITAYNSQPTLANANDQQAATARNNLNSEFAAMFGRDATANSDAMNRLAAAYAVQQGNTLNQANAQRQGYLAQQGQLGQEKADYGLTYGAGLQTSRDKAAADQAKLELAAKALGIKTKTLNKVQIPLAKSLSKDRTNKQKVARTNARTNRANAQTKAAAQALGVAKEARQAYLDAHPEIKKGARNASGRTAGETTAHHKIIRAVDNATEDVTRGRQGKLSDKAIRGAMQLNKIPNDVIDSAFALADGKPLSAKDINRLRNAGLIAAPRRWKKGKQTPTIGGVVQGVLQKLGQ